ncbi:MAG: L-lysine dehydrogenase [Ignavibacteriae bacterium]|nr:MAG: L-lysine dehydrogenase [Ignavibacteriota bacterium]
MRALVIGAGMMGSALAYDLAHSNMFDEVLISDVNLQKAVGVAEKINKNVEPIQLDVNNYDDVIDLMSGVDVVISAVPYSYNYLLTKASLEAEKHFLDLGGSNEILKKQLQLNEKAKEIGVSIIPNCGLAPGLVNILAVEGAKEFDLVDEIHLRVGGLPQHPRPPLNYQIVFSAEGLLNEYTEPVEVIRNGKFEIVNSLDDVEEIIFPEPFGALEAFNTSGGLSTLCQYFLGKVKELDYKTIRYKGHCEKIKTLLELGFASNETLIIGNTITTPREFFIDLLSKKLNYNDEDVVLLKTEIKGEIEHKPKILVYEMIDYFDKANQISAMMRTTSYPTSIIAQMLLDGRINERGVVPPEYCTNADEMIKELRKRDIFIAKTIISGEE